MDDISLDQLSALAGPFSSLNKQLLAPLMAPFASLLLFQFAGKVVAKHRCASAVKHAECGSWLHHHKTGWWFQTRFIVHNIWDNPSH